MKNEVKLLAIGTIVTVVTFLAAKYTEGFVTWAAYNEDKTIIKVIEERLFHIQSDVKDLKDMLKERKR